MHRHRVLIALALILPACTAAPVELPKDPNLSEPRQLGPAPLTTPSIVPIARPAKFDLPSDEVGLAVRQLVDANERLTGDEASAVRDEAMRVVHRRPGDVVRAFDRAYDKLTSGDQGSRWMLVWTLADLGLDQALETLAKIADQPIPEVPAESRVDGVQPSTLAANREGILTSTASIDGIAKIARTGSAFAKGQANAQLFTYFTHPERSVKRAAVIGYLRGQSNLTTAKAVAAGKLAAADQYILNLTWGKNPGAASGLPTKRSTPPGDVATKVPTFSRTK
jgi:hypothetical protein